MIPLIPILAGVAVVGGAAIFYFTRDEDPIKRLQPLASKPIPPIVLTGVPAPPPPIGFIAAQVIPPPPLPNLCTFGIAADCYWTPARVKPLGKSTFKWGYCVDEWTDDMYEGEKGAHTIPKKIFDVLRPIADTLSLGLSDALLKALCIRWEFSMRRYELGGKTYWGIAYTEPEKSILGVDVRPPANPLGTEADESVAWIHRVSELHPGTAVLRGFPNAINVYYMNGAQRTIVPQEDLRTAMRDIHPGNPVYPSGGLPPAALAVWVKSQGGGKWTLSTRKKATAVYR